MKTHIFFLLLFCAEGSLGQDWIQFERYETNVEDVYTGDQTTRLDDTLIRRLRSVSTDAEDIPQADIAQTEIILDENGNPRDKRAFGFIIRGLASALGYTLNPLQVASLPNPSPPPPALPVPPAAPPKAPAPAAPPKAPAPAPAAPRKPPPPPAASPAKPPAPPQPRQRETVRITGLVNFGPNANANLPAQLGQYEQLFHGNAASAAPPPASPPASPPAPPTPRPAPGPMLKMVLTEIPNPIVPNLSPLLPASRPPLSIPGNTPTKTSKQEVETEYRNTEDLNKYNVQNEEINGDRNLYAQVPEGVQRQQGIDWRQGYAERLRELEERQKEYANRLAKHEALLVKQQQDYEDTDERFANREKEIAERDKTHTARLKERERERDSHKEEEESKANAEDSRADYEDGDKSSEGYERPQNSENEEEQPDKQEIEEERAPKQHSDYEEEPKKYQDYDDYPQKYNLNYFNEDGDKLPISKDKEILRSENPRNSYGESLEDRGEIDENIADYFAKFKDPNTGLYMPEKTQNPENYRREKEPWWKGNQEDFDARLEHLRQEYSAPAPESKYEEYELEEAPEDNENTKSAEKSESNNDEADETPQPNRAQKIPDYSEAFGGYEPYVKKAEQEADQEIIPLSIDTVESPKSESRQNSNENQAESEKESEKSEDRKEIPFYQFDFKGFAPYYSPVKYFYDSDETEPGLPRIQSYNRNAEAPDRAEPTKEDLPVEKEEPNEEYQPTIGPPEKLSIKNLHDGESKELHAWPAPFDYVFDSTEQTNVAELPRIQTEDADEDTSDATYRSEGLHATPVAYLVPEYDNEFRNRQGIQQQQSEPESFHGHLSGTKNLHEHPKYHEFQGYSRPFSALEDKSRHHQVTNVPKDKYNSQGSDKPVSRDEISGLLSPQTHNHRYSGNDYPSVSHQRGHVTNRRPDDGSNYQNVRTSSRPSSEEMHNHESRRQYHPIESQPRTRITHDDAPISQNGPGRQFGPGNADLRNRGHDFSQHYTPAKPRLNGRRFDESADHQLENQGPISHIQEQEDKSSLKFEDPKSAHDFFGFSQNDYDYENNKKIEKSEDIKNTPSINDRNEASDLLVVTDPTPYEYDEKLTKFTDEPESDTEKVKVKEYRNKQATVTISETKQLSPEGPVHLIGYSHQY